MTRFEPTNEIGTIFLFAQECDKNGITLLNIQSSFPDAIISTSSGMTYRVEFEYRLSNFIDHGHSIRECDLVICYIIDVEDFVLPVIGLENPDWNAENIKPVDQSLIELYFWKYKTMRLSRENNRLKEQLKVHGDILKQNTNSTDGHFVGEPCPKCGRSDFSSRFQRSGHIGRCRGVAHQHVVDGNGNGGKVN